MTTGRQTDVLRQRVDSFLLHETRSRTLWMLSSVAVFTIVTGIQVWALGVDEERALHLASVATVIYMVVYLLWHCTPKRFEATTGSAVSGWNPLLPALTTPWSEATVVPRRSFGYVLGILGLGFFAFVLRKVQAEVLDWKFEQAGRLKNPQEKLAAVKSIVSNAHAAKLPYSRQTSKLALDTVDGLARSLSNSPELLKTVVQLRVEITMITSTPPRYTKAGDPMKLRLNVSQYGESQSAPSFGRIHTLGRFVIDLAWEDQYGYVSHLRLPSDLAEPNSGVREFRALGITVESEAPEEELGIDGWRADGAYFKNCLIRYDGGPISLVQVGFFDCSFTGSGAMELKRALTHNNDQSFFNDAAFLKSFERGVVDPFQLAQRVYGQTFA